MNGHTYSEIVAVVGVHMRTVQFWWQRYGFVGLKATVDGGERGVAIGERHTLSASQEITIQSLITDKMLDRHKFVFALWIRTALKEIIRKEFRLDMPIAACCRRLKIRNAA